MITPFILNFATTDLRCEKRTYRTQRPAPAAPAGRLYFGDFEPVAGLQEIQPADDGQSGVSGILFGSSNLGIGEDISPVECDAKAELSAGADNHQSFLGACGGEVQP
jgi:hypothetical protein